MTNRIKKISSYIESEEKVIDVGCDQALLSIELAKRNIYSIASDLRTNIIENAQNKLNENLKKYITFRVGNGITLKEEENDYVLVMAGMGSYLMIDILKNTDKKFKKIITISNNNHDMLRCEFLKLGYTIYKEEIIKEKGKYYNLIVFIPGTHKYTKEDIIIGINHQNIDLLKEKNNFILSKYKKIINKISKESDKQILIDKIKILENYNCN